MSQPDVRYLELAEKWMNGTITHEEEVEFARWYNSGNNDDLVLSEEFAANKEELQERILQKDTTA